MGVERGVAGGLVGTGEGPGLSGPGAAAGAGAGEPGWGEPALQVRGPKPSGGESIPVEERSGGMTIDVPIRLSFGEGFSILEPGPSMLINVAPDLGDRISLVFAKQGASRAKGAPKEDDIAGPSKRDWSAGRKRLTPGEIRRLEKAGYDAESIKDDVGAAGKHDLFKDSDGNIYVHPRMVLVLVSQLV